MMIPESGSQPTESRPRGSENLSIALNEFSPRTKRKIDLHGAGALPLEASVRNSTRTLRGTVRELIDLKQTPRLKFIALSVLSQIAIKPSAEVEAPRISAIAASNVQSQVQKLVADGHVVAELDPTSATKVTYRCQGNLDHYTEDNLAKRFNLQQHPHMIALTQRLWSCALRNGETKLTFADYEKYMLCLHRLVLPDFEIAASRELILDDWKRDCGEQDHLDYSFFHLSMFELVDLWTDTVDAEDYISLLYCISHCLTYLLNERHVLKALDDVSIVDVLEQSKGVTMEAIDHDLQRELTSDAFAFHHDLIKLATEANQTAERGSRELGSPSKRAQVTNQGPSRPQSRGSLESGNPRRQSQSKREVSDDSSIPQVQERRRSPLMGEQKAVSVISNAKSTPRRRSSRFGSSGSNQNFAKRKVSVRASKKSINSIPETLEPDKVHAATTSLLANNFLTEVEALSNPRQPKASKQSISPSAYSLGLAVSSSDTVDDVLITTAPVDAKSPVALTSDAAQVTMQDVQSGLNSSPHRQDEAGLSISGKDNSTSQYSERQAIPSEAALPTSSPRAQDLIAPGHHLIPDANKSRRPFTKRAAAVAEVAKLHSARHSRRSSSVQRTLHQGQQPTSPFILNHTARETFSNVFFDNGSLTAPLMTIQCSNSKIPTLTPSVKDSQLKVQEMHGTRLQMPHRNRSWVLNQSSQASIAVTAQSVGLYMSPQHQPVKLLSSPRSLSVQRSGSIMNSDRRRSKLPFYQQYKLLPLVPSFMSATGPLAINGKMAPKLIFERPVEANFRLSAGETDGGYLRALLPPRYVIPETVASHSPVSYLNVKQFSGSTRGYNGMKESSRNRHRHSSLSYYTATNHPQQHPIELAIVPKID